MLDGGRPDVFPTGVGMNRIEEYNKGGMLGVPHRRGDEPQNLGLADLRRTCSPQAWG